MKARNQAAIGTHRFPPFDHVFVATDFSAGAAHAIARAAHVPLADGGEITVAHVLSAVIPDRARATAEKLARHGLAVATKTIAKAAARLGRRDIKVSSELFHGQGYVEIIRHARAIAADLIVLGKHGRRPVRDIFIGSTAARVIRAGDLAVLVVSGKPSRGYRRPVVAVDLEDTCRSVVTIALRIVGPDVTRATMVHGYQVPFEGFIKPGVTPATLADLRKEYKKAASAGIARLEASLGDLGVEWQDVVARGDPRSVVVTEAALRRADLIVVGSHGRTGLSHALIGSVAEGIIQAATCDVLVARPARVSFELP